TDLATTDIYTLSLHDALPICLDKVNVEPVYKKFPGWDTPSSKAATAQDLPESMKSYIGFINEYLGVNIRYISNGPGRNQIISIRSEEHTSELQSRENLVCRLL